MKKFLIYTGLIMGIICGGIFGVNLGRNLHFGGSLDAYAEELPKWKKPEIYIKAINPGYTVDGKSNVGEMIEIGRKNSDAVMSLAGLTIGYHNSSGNEVLLVDLSKYIWKAGETILLRLASSPQSELANLQYSKSLAFKAGPLTLKKDGEAIDAVCWTGKDGCYNAFNSSKPTSLVRDDATGDFGHLSDYAPAYLAENVSVEMEEPEEEVRVVASQCKGVEFSEILSYYDTLQSEQFVELHNRNSEAVLLDGCTIRYKNKNYPLEGMILADGYLVRLATDFKLTKNPTTSNTLELIDADGTILDKLIYPNGQKKGTAYAMIGYDDNGEEIWKVTYLPTPGEANVYQEFRTCETGKVINEATGNCVKVTTVAEKICGEGQYLNILTGRCKKIPETSTGSKECKEGYYYYEETGRCRKIKENSGDDYALVPETFTSETSFVALYLVLGVVGIGLVYVIYEFRHEIMRVARRVIGR